MRLDVLFDDDAAHEVSAAGPASLILAGRMDVRRYSIARQKTWGAW